MVDQIAVKETEMVKAVKKMEALKEGLKCMYAFAALENKKDTSEFLPSKLIHFMKSGKLDFKTMEGITAFHKLAPFSFSQTTKKG